MPEPLIVRVHTNPETGDRTLTVDAWPRETKIDAAFLAQADERCVKRVDDLVTVTVANGQAVYELGEPDLYTMAWTARLVSSRLSEAP